MEIVVPELGESIVEATVARWLKKEGDRVTSGQVLGTVAARDKPELQFDVFRGTSSVDPTPYLGGG